MNLNITTDTYGTGDQRWLGSAHGTDMLVPVTLDVSTFTPATHYPQGFIPSGTPIGVITAAGPDVGKYGPYSDAAVDGRQTLVGHVMNDTKVNAAVPTQDVQAAMFAHGRVVTANLPIPAAIDAAAKADVAGRIWYV